MDKHTMQILMSSLTFNVILGLAFYNKHQTLKSYKENYQKLATWARLMGEINRMHIENGGDFRVTPEMEDKLTAYAIFVENDLN